MRAKVRQAILQAARHYRSVQPWIHCLCLEKWLRKEQIFHHRLARRRGKVFVRRVYEKHLNQLLAAPQAKKAPGRKLRPSDLAQSKVELFCPDSGTGVRQTGCLILRTRAVWGYETKLGSPQAKWIQSQCGWGRVLSSKSALGEEQNIWVFR